MIITIFNLSLPSLDEIHLITRLLVFLMIKEAFMCGLMFNELTGDISL